MSTPTATPCPATAPSPRSRPSYVGVELRLTIEEAEALTEFLDRQRAMLEFQLKRAPDGTRESRLGGVLKLLDRLAQKQPPFDES